MVAVVLGAALAAPRAHAEVELVEHETTRAACLATWEKAVDLDQVAPVPSALVREQCHQHRPACVADGARQRPIADHATDVEVFDHDRLVFANEPGTQLVEMVPTSVADACMQSRELASCFVSIFRSFLRAGVAPRQDALARELSGVVPRVGDLLSGRERHQRVQADVDADRRLDALEGLDRGVLAQQRDVPAARRIEAHRHRGGLDTLGQRTTPTDVERRVHLREPQRAILHAEGAARVLGRTAIAALLEARVLRSLREEVLVRRLQVPQRLLKRDAGDLVEKRQLLGLLPRGECSALRDVADRLLSAGPRFGALMQRLVVDEPHTAERASQERGLLRGRLKAVAEGPKHAHNLARLLVTATNPELHFLPALKDGVSMQEIG